MNREYFISSKELTVGYNGKPLINNINFGLNKGEILTLIGPNGAGKSTILKSITKHLSIISGLVYIDKDTINSLSNKEIAKKLAVVLTERITPEMMTCKDVVASGRYPYTNSFGKLTEKDNLIVEQSMKKVQATDLADCQFSDISDGQRQRIMLARALCQQPQIIVLDEPTSFLDIRHKTELLDILREMATENNLTVIMSLHEIDLAAKISDKVMCVKGDTISKFGTPEEIFTEDIINKLYDIKEGSYNMLFGSVELAKPEGKPKIFVIAGNGCGTPIYRMLQKSRIPFYTGILYKNDVDFQVARALATDIISIPPFCNITEEIYQKAIKTIDSVDIIIDAGTPIGDFNSFNTELFNYGKAHGKKIVRDLKEINKLVWKYLDTQKVS